MTELEAVQNEYNKLGPQKNFATKAENFWGFTFLAKPHTDPVGITNRNVVNDVFRMVLY